MELQLHHSASALNTSIEAKQSFPPLTPTIVSSASPLLALPGELRNAILDLLLLPSNSKIFVFASRDYASSPRLHYKYWQYVPCILQTCRQLRADGLGHYHASNTFRFTRRMLDHPRVFEGFLHARRWGIEHLQRVEVTRCVSITFACRNYRDRRSEPADPDDGLAWLGWDDWDVSFVAAATTGAESFEVTVLSTEQRSGWVYDEGEREGLCCCALVAMARATPVRQGAMARLLRDYFDRTDAYSEIARDRIRDGWARRFAGRAGSAEASELRQEDGGTRHAGSHNGPFTAGQSRPLPYTSSANSPNPNPLRL